MCLKCNKNILDIAQIFKVNYIVSTNYSELCMKVWVLYSTEIFREKNVPFIQWLIFPGQFKRYLLVYFSGM